jgi:hypothetical protein
MMQRSLKNGLMMNLKILHSKATTKTQLNQPTKQTMELSWSKMMMMTVSFQQLNFNSFLLSLQKSEEMHIALNSLATLSSSFIEDNETKCSSQ